ncbi:Ku protein [Streptomyces albireticuli]|uniref:Non-homologous end joining protein Ku n=2 Tax=Streptomyces albireticuli TaxID=1940 RepID=A0A2A2D0S0_9ACTN|nr:Ku protein [Streptomyces albireticuli]MCD9145352.1 Ku protein [Streptomyces albireticuli]MCD9165083.1 Ku protein [Streptomyces albireticuli]MCD9195326.1 Ku protein [Streptomyces albireticuli]PAU45111.1 Ku protein [Streptomyces albireticuli]
MRTMWKGAIGFGLVSVPVRLYAATQEHGVRLHQVHDKDGGRIHLKRVCDVCGEQIDYEHIAKGFEDDEGHTAVVTQGELAGLPLPSKKLIDVLAFVDSDRIDPLQLASSYYLAPESAAANKPYVLLRETLKQTDRVAVTKIALRTRESLALLRVHGDLLTLHTMYWPDEVRDSGDLAPPGSVTVRPQELKMATSLMDTLSEDFDLEEQEDEYEVALRELIDAHLSDRPVPRKKTAPAPDNVIDLMAALQASIDSAGKKTPEGEAGKKAPAAKPARGATKKAAAPKKSTASAKSPSATAKKTTARKTTAKSTAAGSTTAKSTKKTAAKKTGRRAS